MEYTSEQWGRSQDKLFRWLNSSASQTVSYHSLSRSATSLLAQYHPASDDYSAWEKLVWPLLRSGVIYFAGNGQYALSPSVKLQNNRYCLLVNTVIPGAFPTKEVDQVGPGQYLIAISNAQRVVWDIPEISFSLTTILHQLPTIKQIVQNGFLKNPGMFQFRYRKKGREWINYTSTGIPETGIYSNGDYAYAPKFLILEGICYDIPSREEQPDGYTLANWAIQLSASNTKTGLVYDRRQERLQIDVRYFPLEIEKLLYLNTIIVGEQAVTQGFSRLYTISPSAYRQLNRIFHQQIPMK